MRSRKCWVSLTMFSTVILADLAASSQASASNTAAVGRGGLPRV